MVVPFGAVVLAGGTAARLGGVAKAGLEHAGRTLLEHALAAVAGAEETVVVGPAVPTSRPVRFTREDPPGGGPAAGLLAGVDALTDIEHLRSVVVLAVDMPRVSAATVHRLLAAAADREGAFLVDPSDGRRALAGVLALPALARVRPPDPHGLPVRRLLADLDLADVPAREDEARDVDTWADLRGLRRAPGSTTV